MTNTTSAVAHGLPPITSVIENNLTTQQTRVLKLMADGLSNKQIARALAISPGTVKLHVTAILKRLELPNRTAAALQFVRSRAQVH